MPKYVEVELDRIGRLLKTNVSSGTAVAFSWGQPSDNTTIMSLGCRSTLEQLKRLAFGYMKQSGEMLKSARLSGNFEELDKGDEEEDGATYVHVRCIRPGSLLLQNKLKTYRQLL